MVPSLVMPLPTSRHAVSAVIGLLATAMLAPSPVLAASPEKPPNPMHAASQALAAPAANPAVVTAYPAVTPLRARPAAQRPTREVYGFAQAGGIRGGTGAGWDTWDYSLLTTVAYFGLHVNSGDGHLVTNDTAASVWQGSDVTNMINAAHSAGVRVDLTIVLQASSGTECTGLQNRQTTVADTVAQVAARGVDGVNVDYESGNAACAGTDNQSLLTDLVQRLRAQLPSGRNHLVVDTYASAASDPRGFYGIAAMKPYVDGFFIMAYELDGSTAGGGNWSSPPVSCSSYCFTPTSPISAYNWSDTRSVSDYVSVAGASKTILGLPYYGYAACVQSQAENAYPDSNPQWSIPTQLGIRDLPGSVSGYADHRDTHNGVDRWATYTNSVCSGGHGREMYIDDAYSLGKKYDLVVSSGILGTGMWSLDMGGGLGYLWDAIATHFTNLPASPASVSTCGTGGAAYVSWTPGSGGGAVASYTVTANPGGASVTVAGTARAATVPGLTAGTAYTLSVVANNSYGPSVATSASVTPAASAGYGYFTWFDRVSPGMNGDNIHLVNTGSGTAMGCVYVSGQAVTSFSIPQAQQTYLTFPGLIGGPVIVATTGGSTAAAQRVQYNQSFNEVAAQSTLQTTLYFPWYDRASPGMVADNIHVINPGASDAHVTITGPSSPGSLTVKAGSEGIFSWPAGTIGGPVKLVSDAGVIASQRIQYYDTFNETRARSAAAQDIGPSVVFNWYDQASPGMWNTNLHIVNPGTSDVNATIVIAGTSQTTLRVPAGGESIAGFPNVIGGPVQVNATGPVIVNQRVQYYNSFNEVAGTPTGAATNASWSPWYDDASPGMVADNIHILNPDPAHAAQVAVSGPGASKSFALAALSETWVSWPGTIGGPVHVTSTGAAVIVSQRVQYYQTFNEAVGFTA